MAAGTAEPARGRRLVAAGLVAAVILATATYAARASNAIRDVAAVRPVALLGDRNPAARGRLATLGDGQVRLALAASPLSARLVNVAMVRAADRGAAPAPWLAQVGRLGWRDTTSLQNRLYVAARGGDLDAVLDDSDALLRRRVLTEQIVPVLSLVETDSALRARLAARLAARPRWRGTYLSMTGHLQAPDRLRARFALLQALAARGGIERGEALGNVNLLEAGGEPGLALAVWQKVEPGITRPLNDGRFRRAARNPGTDEERPVAFEWEMLSGEGFGAGATAEGGASRLEIDWDGRGVPVFARQRTSAGPGGYALAVQVAPHEVPELSVLTFRLRCPDGAVALRPVAGSPTRLVTQTRVSCGYPVLEIAGDVQPSASPHQIAIDGLALRPLGTAR
jgi:hypothetical protein